jgi:hypothetical protein
VADAAKTCIKQEDSFDIPSREDTTLCGWLQIVECMTPANHQHARWRSERGMSMWLSYVRIQAAIMQRLQLVSLRESGIASKQLGASDTNNPQ